MQKWEQPKVVRLDALPEALGKCHTGSTAIGSSCATGEKVTPGTSGCAAGYTVG